MQRFFKRIQEKALNPGEPPVLIVAFGDSVTQGVMEHRLLDSAAVFHRRVQEKLEAFFPLTTFSTLNAGVSGGTARQGLDRLERDIFRHQPDLVFVAFGLNDSLAGQEKRTDFEEALFSIQNQIRERTDANIIQITPPFMATRHTSKIHPEHERYADHIIRIQSEGILAHYAESIRDVAKRQEVPVVDVHREWERLRASGFDTDLWLGNGLNHPARAGHALAADLIYSTILQSHIAG